MSVLNTAGQVAHDIIYQYVYIYIYIIIIIIILPMRIAISWGSLHVKTPMTGIMMVIPSWPLVFHPKKTYDFDCHISHSCIFFCRWYMWLVKWYTVYVTLFHHLLVLYPNIPKNGWLNPILLLKFPIHNCFVSNFLSSIHIFTMLKPPVPPMFAA